MGYFSNGTEGEYYRSAYCENCIHDINNDCPIWNLHLLWNYEAVGTNKDEDKELALEMFIPRSKNGLNNEQCKMFIKKED